MPFPQLPSGKDIGDAIKGVFYFFAAIVVIASAYQIYQIITTAQ